MLTVAFFGAALDASLGDLLVEGAIVLAVLRQRHFLHRHHLVGTHRVVPAREVTPIWATGELWTDPIMGDSLTAHI